MLTNLADAADDKRSAPIHAGRVPLPSHRVHNDNSRLAVVITLVTSVVVLYVAREVLLPLALAILLSFVLAPLVNRLARLGLGRLLSVLIAATLSLLVIAALGGLMIHQTMGLAENLPRYRDNIRQKITSLQFQSGGALGRATDTLKQIGEEMLQADTPPASAPEQMTLTFTPSAPIPPFIAPVTKPVRVEIVEKPTNPLESITGTFAPLANPLVSAGIVIIFVILILLHREDLRNRVISLIGPGQLTSTTQAMDEGASRLSRYLLMLLIVNGTYGLGVGVGLFFVGVPNAVLFGVLAGLLRFIPYVGPWVAAALPIMLSLAVFDSWTRPLITIGVFVVLELISNNVVEPWLYGSRTGVSATAIVVSAVFWGWLWGPLGLIMATPLTVCLVVTGRYVPQLAFLSVLLGDRPSLPPESRVYQRLLAMDYDEVFQFTQEHLRDKPLIDLYENVLMPALAMAEHDRHAGRLEEGQHQFICRSLRDLIEELGDRQKLTERAEAKVEAKAAARAEAKAEAQAEAEAGDAAAATAPSAVAAMTPAPIDAVPPLPSSPAGIVLCIPARDEADEISALMLAQLLEFQGVTAKVIAVTTLADEMLDEMGKQTLRSVCVCAMPPTAASHARYACKRILARFGDMKLVVGIWNASDLDRARERIRTWGTDRVVATFTHAIEALRS